MKKKIVTVIMASMLFAGAVSATSVWGLTREIRS